MHICKVIDVYVAATNSNIVGRRQGEKVPNKLSREPPLSSQNTLTLPHLGIYAYLRNYLNQSGAWTGLYRVVF